MKEPSAEIFRGTAPSSEPPLSASARAVARSLRRPALAPEAIGLVAAGLDFAAMALGLWFAAFAASGQSRPLPALLGAVAAVALERLMAGYRLAALRHHPLPGLCRMMAVGAATAAIAGTGAWAAALGVFAFALPARALAGLISGCVLDFGLTERRAVVVGGGAEAARLIDGLASNPGNDIRICGLFDDRDDGRSPPVVTGVPKLGTTQALVDFAREAEIDMLICALPLTAERRIRELLRPLDVLPLDVRLSAFSSDMSFPRRSDSGLVGLRRRPLDTGDALLKRLFDLVVGSAALVLLALPMLAVAAAIRLESRGPVFFRQPRHGFNHRIIEVWKFRSMYADQCDVAARQIVTRDDPRVTRVGRFIRRTSIDELPQLFNVLLGDLSLVGPRPHAVVALSSRQQAFADIIDDYAARHKMRPGITGWAQINGWRGEIDDPEKLHRRVEHDLSYIENWSFGLDLKILALTPFRLIDSRGAY